MASKTCDSKVGILVTLVATALLFSCSTVPVHDTASLPPLENQQAAQLPQASLTAVSPEMKQFLEWHVPANTPKAKLAWTLAVLMTDPYILQFEYNPAVTLPPAETFNQRTGNCLSFSLMLVAMAREVGVPARFQEVVLEPDYNSVNDTFINSRHINVVLGRGHDVYLIDVSGQILDNAVRSTRIPDHKAAAQYYNNLGVSALLEDDLPTAWGRFNQAIATDPDLAYLWSNLGVVYNRNGQVRDAEWSYQRSLAVDSRDNIATNNLYVIYQQEGRFEEAAQLERKVERHRKRNPYYLAKLASDALSSREYQQAINLLEQSIRMDDKEYRFHGALAQAHYLAGNHDDARLSLDLARSLAPPEAADSMQSLPLASLPD